MMGDKMTAIGKGFVATLSSNERGPILTRRASTSSEAISAAHVLLDRAEDQQWHLGERVSAQIAQSDD
jgi:hypothetical protein